MHAVSTMSKGLAFQANIVARLNAC